MPKTKTKIQQKEYEYAVIILRVIREMLDKDSDLEHKIDLAELQQGDNLTHFFHALTNIAPTGLYNDMTGENLNLLQFNHLANQLIFQYQQS